MTLKVHLPTYVGTATELKIQLHTTEGVRINGAGDILTEIADSDGLFSTSVDEELPDYALVTVLADDAPVFQSFLDKDQTLVGKLKDQTATLNVVSSVCTTGTIDVNYQPLSDLNEYYGTIAGGNEYFRLTGQVWHASTDTEKENALIEATRNIDRLNFKGTSGGGPLAFPLVNQTSVPIQIEAATYEESARLLEDLVIDVEVDSLRVTEDRYASVVVKRDTTWVPEHLNAGILSIRAWHLLKPFLNKHKTVKLLKV